jgi:3-oxoacyl-[acyl-carrier-protein] synthase-1
MAIAEAADLVRSGALKACLAGGIDILNLLTIKGFESLQVVDFDICKPFADERKGINLGEGGAIFLLEASPSESAIGRVLGAGMSSDAFHMTQPRIDGQGMSQAMEKALSRNGVFPNQVTYINAHGTGTLSNDQAEKLAIERVFGSFCQYESTKQLSGHTLAGSGALEAAISLIRLRQAERSDGIALSNSFGFGGCNVSLLLDQGRDYG